MFVDRGPGYDEYFHLMYALPLIKDAHMIVETGLSEGDSTAIWVRSLSSMKDPKSRTLFTYETDVRQRAVDRINKIPPLCKWEIKGDSRTGGEYLPKGTIIDILYLDAGHDFESVDGEIHSFAPFLSPSAVILVHDSWEFYPLGSPQQEVRKETYPSGYVGPGDPYRAIKRWADESEGKWQVVLMTSPTGMTLCYRNRE